MLQIRGEYTKITLRQRFRNPGNTHPHQISVYFDLQKEKCWKNVQVRTLRYLYSEAVTVLFSYLISQGMEFSQQTVQDLIQNKMQVLFLCTISLRVKPFSSEFHNKEQTQKSSNKHVRIRLFLHRYKFQGELNMELWLCYSCWETEWSLHHRSSGEQSIKSRAKWPSMAVTPADI